MKKSIILITIIMMIGMWACSDMTGGQLEDPNTNGESTTNQPIEAKGYLSVMIDEDGGRTILPTSVMFADLSYDLSGIRDEVPYSFGEFSYTELMNIKIELLLGSWTFTLNAKRYGEIILTSTVNRTIYAGYNTISFNLKGLCDLSVDIRYPRGKVGRVTALLENNSTDEVSDRQTLSITDCTDDVEKNQSLYNLQNIPSGLYRLSVSLYQDASDDTPINTQMCLVRIADCCISVGTMTFETVNSYWTITYHLNGEDITTDTYNQCIQIILPIGQITDETFDIGYWWYDNADLSGDKIMTIDYDSSGDKEYWLATCEAIVVSVSELAGRLSSLNAVGGLYYVILTDDNPDMNLLKTTLLNYSSLQISLDMSRCRSLTIIGSNAFDGCSGLTSITIPNSVTSIGSNAFSGCNGLTSAIIESDTYFGSGNLCFTKDNIKYKVLNKNSVEIVANSYSGDVVIPATVFFGNTYSVTSIGDSTFNGCSGLTSIEIPDSVTNIGGSAFYGCSGLTSVTVPDSVTSIGGYAFNGCSGLTEPVYNTHVFAYMPTSYSGSYTISSGITSIAGGAFYYCSGLTSVIIPDSVTSIGDKAFYNCSGLTSIEIPDNVTDIGNSAFFNCKKLTSVTIPDSVTSIGDRAFYNCSGLTSVTIPDSVTSIGSHAFYNCSGLTSVTIPDSVTSIGSCAFYNCSGLRTLNVKATIPPSFGSNMLEDCSALRSIYVPTGYVNTYKAADGWKSYSSKIEGKSF